MPSTTKAKAKNADALLAAVCADPDDDTARLAYADFLEEHKNPERAEFIRVQIELAQLSPWDRKAKLLRFRERLLLVRHGEGWRAELPELGGVEWGKFERGFVSEVTLESLKVLTKRFDVIRAASPVTAIQVNSLDGITSKPPEPHRWLRSVRLGAACAAPGVVSQFVSSHWVGTLTRLEIGTHVSASDVVAIAGANRLANLQELHLCIGTVGDVGLNAIAKSENLANLRLLRLPPTNAGGQSTDAPITLTGIKNLATSPNLTNLTNLDLGNQRFTDDGVRAILTSATLAKLDTVSFSGSALTARAFELTAGPIKLRDVNLNQCVIGDAGAVALAKSPHFSKVAKLNLRACEVGAKGIAALAASNLAKHLRELDLADNPVRASGIQELAKGRWPELHTLNLATSGLGSESMKAFQAAEGFGRLLDLDLSSNEVGAAGAIAVTRAKWAGQMVRLNLAESKCVAGAILGGASTLRKLQYLDVTDNPLMPAGVEALLEGEWIELTDLKIGGTSGGDAGAKALATSGLLSRLVTLAIERFPLTPEGLATLLSGPAPSLVEFDLSDNITLGDEAVRLLSNTSMPALRTLSVATLGMTEAGLPQLLAAPTLAQVKKLEYHGNPITDDLQQAFWARFGNPQPDPAPEAPTGHGHRVTIR
ncbi:MAG: TIGR02996 domain-containing protein [Planctomycetes bacterium]|nr:TIGR02996 domain-containing protein [Planctomycetota bacterium]